MKTFVIIRYHVAGSGHSITIVKADMSLANEVLILFEEDEVHYHELGYVKHKEIDLKNADQRVEYDDDEKSDFWNKAPKWHEIKYIKTNVTGKGHGKKLLKSYMDNVPKGHGVVLNASPEDESKMSTEKLTKWYKNQGFKHHSAHNSSLYRIISG
jgi:hypothetical protein